MKVAGSSQDNVQLETVGLEFRLDRGAKIPAFGGEVATGGEQSLMDAFARQMQWGHLGADRSEQRKCRLRLQSRIERHPQDYSRALLPGIVACLFLLSDRVAGWHRDQRKQRATSRFCPGRPRLVRGPQRRRRPGAPGWRAFRAGT